VLLVIGLIIHYLDNMKQPAARLVLQYWYTILLISVFYQYLPVSAILVRNTGITSIFQNLPVSAIMVLPVFPRIYRYLQYSYFGNDQYLLVLQILENSGRYWDTSIYQYLYQYCRYWKILVKYWYYQYCSADTGRFWKILVIPVLQILENTGYTSIADIGRLGRIPVNPSFYVYIILKE
jgi:hypothetical protein